MAYSKDRANTQYNLNNIQERLKAQVEESRTRSPRSFSTPIYVLPATDDNIEHQLEQHLNKERNENTGKRIVLIPYCLENSHWIGILIEFQTDQQILRAECIDPVDGSTVVPDRLKEKFTDVYPSIVLRPKNLSKHNDRSRSAALTVQNLLAAVEVDQSPTPINPGVHKSGEGNPCRLQELVQKFSNELMQRNIKSAVLLSAEIDKTLKRIDECEEREEISDFERETKVLEELKQLQNLWNEIREKFENSLAKFNLQNIDQLIEVKKDTEEQIQRFERLGKKEKAQKERTSLAELKELEEVSDRITELSSDVFPFPSDVESELLKLEEMFNSGLAKINLQNIDELLEEINETEEQIQRFEKQQRKKLAEEEKIRLAELKDLKEIYDRITELTAKCHAAQNESNSYTTFWNENVNENIPPSDPSTTTIDKPPFERSQPDLSSTDMIIFRDREKKLSYVKELCDVAKNMPTCARKTVIELLVYFEEILLGKNKDSQEQDALISSVQTLKTQLKREELLSDYVKEVLHYLETNIGSKNDSNAVLYLNELLKRIRSLNVPEIQKLVAKATQAAELIKGKDIVLLIGKTGSGKSTTIQFLAGAKMEKVQVEISFGKYLEHVTAVEPIKNPDLKHVISSPFCESETRYIAPVTVQLQDVLGSYESGVLILCDAPGFEDTAGAEVDIANSIGVIQALQGANSVQVLALLSFKALGDRGEGVQKLAHTLIDMVHGIEDRFDAITYAFTKYPEETDINAQLIEIKQKKVDKDKILKADTAFVKLLIDMIEKTEDHTFKIQPIKDEPKKLLRSLKKVRGIKNPAEIFRFSMSEKTRATVLEYVQRDKSSIICAMRHQDNSLVLYYFNDLQILKDLIKDSSIRDIYEESIRFVSESVSHSCAEVRERFNRALASQDGLQEKDIRDYQVSIEHLKRAQILKDHLGPSLLLPALMLQNIIIQLNEISRHLKEQKLHSPLVTIYLENLSMLKNSFSELEETYENSCEIFQNRFDALVENARELIPNNDFQQIADILFDIFQSAHALKHHFHARTERAHSDIINHLLQYLDSFSEKVEPLLAKVRLNNHEVETIKGYAEVLRSAKENATLQERVSKHLETLEMKVSSSDEHSSDERKGNNLKEIYDTFIAKIIKYFDEINQRIKELFDRDGDQALEHIQALVKDMDALRTIPELESKTAETYYRTVENIRNYMQQLKADAEKLVTAIDQQTGITNYRHLARSLARLKSAEWIDQVSPGTYASLMRRITEDLEQFANQLEKDFIKIDFSLKYPNNIPPAKEIVEKIESIRDLERSIPELEKYRTNIVNRFLKCTKEAFDRIQSTFNLQDKDVYAMKQKLEQLEEIKRQYENLHPARLFLQKQGYTDISMLNNEIEDLKMKQKTERRAKEATIRDAETELNKLKAIFQQHETLSSSGTSRPETSTKTRGSGNQAQSSQANAYLQKSEFARIESLYEQISKLENIHRKKSEELQNDDTESSESLRRLESVKIEHDSLLNTRHSSAEEASFLREKGFNSYESLDEAIQTTKVINERAKNQQTHHFTDRLDTAAANNAIEYINQCQRVTHDRVRENAIDANENLRKYIRQYGTFLQQEISRKFAHICTTDTKEGPFLYSQQLETHLKELSSFEKFPLVLECIDDAEVIEQWRRRFLDFYRSLSARMEDCKNAGKLSELRDQLLIAQALACVDHFCTTAFAGNGFAALYRQYQGEIIKECGRLYKIVLEHISNDDFARADLALSDIEDNPLNARDKAQIQNDLQCSLDKLMRDTRSSVNWLDGKITREDNQSQITKIKDNIDKIRIACNKRNIKDLLDEATRKNLQAFDREMNDNLGKIILRGLDSIEAFMDANSFSEADQGMEILSKVQSEFGRYFTSEAVEEKSKKLRESLNRIVDTIKERNDFEDIDSFSTNPPKELLGRLQQVAAHGPRFMQAYNATLGKIQRTFNLAIEEARKASLNERTARIRTLNYALYFLPDDLQTRFKQQIDEMSKSIVDEEKEHRETLDATLTNVDEDENAILNIGQLAERYSTQNMPDLFRRLREQCLKKLQIYRLNTQKSLDAQNIQSAIDNVKKSLMYEEHVGTYIPEIKGISQNIRTLIVQRFLNCCEILSSISTIEQISIVEKAFDDILIYLEFAKTLGEKVKEFFNDDVMRNAQEAFQNISLYFNGNSDKFRVALKDMNILELQKTIFTSRKWQKFLDNIASSLLNHSLVQGFSREIRRVIRFEDMLAELEQTIERFKNQLDVEFINDERTRFGVKREEFFRNLMDVFNTLKSINMKLRDILRSPIDMDALERGIKVKVDRIKIQLIEKASKPELIPRDTDDFRTYYNHLLSFNEHMSLWRIDVKQVLDESQEKIFAKVEALNEQIRNSITDAAAVSITLIKMKFFAENLSMFEKYINDGIDNALKRYKASQGPAGIARLSMELEKSEVGARLITEHSSLSGEDIRKRREKMQKQDDLEYILTNLTGDNLLKDVLRARYNTFRKKYDELITTFLNTLTQDGKNEPDLEVLVSQTKSLVGTVAQTPNSVTWTRPFKENIPKFLAHIFAVWTLKNTQHYNSMRGVGEANAYLLMPHVGQIIAIFRLLGIGYEEYKKVKGFNVPFTGSISDDLVNNLIEVGTGEGKSVVMAITACVFALTGVDVNCSCYSEVLSTRDKNDFTSVFRTLGIEDRIEYGTFNKLCEQLLNQQCNVREKVREMIVNNQDALAATDTASRIRPKILLIDEVDVFLSDKYYGGVYVPAVYLKDPSIKALIDSIWQNKTLRSLNGVKALPAHQTCAAKYSSWIFLFDEAIKDMLAALQSYQSSTYIVQNDRIVYVDGESIVDNVVRGYDTVWTYYHENEKGNVSTKSLEDNVGILITCGTFSYAEIPHDFAFIGGVTGTLRTLAKKEKQILETVYAITKNTFMPSVFGETNRNYNPMNDVRLVKESEYFMEICGEIRTVCNASRAILVFFESEEKLTAFYNSPQFSASKQEVQIITEKVSPKDRELYIKRAATVGKVTLLTRTFGRGTDFICRNQQLLLNGGIHVLQTFFSEELSEEYQIMGRGARQGDKGSYRMILLDKDLEWVLGPTWKEDLPKIIGTCLYNALNSARSVLYESKCGGKDLGIKQCKADHIASKGFMSALTSGDIKAIKDFLLKQNKGANLITASSRTVLLMDATGSMSSLLSAAKETVCTMFERASNVLTQQGLPSDAFQMQFVIYRNYNSNANRILQVSSWSTKASDLRTFMNTIGPEGGMGNEAIEIGLWHAANESGTPDSISQIILIGDAPANSQTEVTQKRMHLAENYWKTTRFNQPTYYTNELTRLKDKKIPVHAFYLTQSAKNNFAEIARETSGRCQELNINSAAGAELLTHFVTEEVLRKTAGDQGYAAVELYRKIYV